MKMLVTGFEPFGGDPENASLEAVRRLADAWATDPQAGVELVTPAEDGSGHPLQDQDGADDHAGPQMHGTDEIFH